MYQYKNCLISCIEVVHTNIQNCSGKCSIVVFTAVIAYSEIFQFFTVRADLLLKWGNQRDNCSGNAYSATAMVGFVQA